MVRGHGNTEDKSNKLYNKVLVYYNKGRLQRALELCENNEDLLVNNSAFLNIKGLMHYLKGEMNEARRCWNLSYKNFADPISEKYLLDSKKDEKLWKNYVRGFKKSKELDMTEAIFELEQCKINSDFNAINVNNQLTQCYLAKSNYDEAISCINRVLDIDCTNKDARANRKNLIDLGIIKNKARHTFIKFLFLVVAVICIISCYFVFFAPKDAIDASDDSAMSSEEQVNKLQAEIDKNNKPDENSKDDEKNESKNNEKFDVDKMDDLVKNKNFQGINDELTKWDSKKDVLSINEKSMFNKCKSFMDGNAGEYFYRTAFGLAKTSNYKEAIEYYNIGLKYGVGHFPYEDALYMLAVAYNKSNDYDNSIKIFERYCTEYKEKTYIIDGNYIEDALRYLVSMTKGIDDKKCHQYSIELDGVIHGAKG